VDKLITAARNKSATLAIRHINAVVTDKNACRKIMEVFKPRYAKRTSGLTRMTAVGARLGDGAKMVDLTMMDRDIVIEKVEKPAKKTTSASSKK
jgi:ribosomal protein L17